MIGEIKILKVFKSKNSKLKIETEDNCVVFAKNKQSNIIIDLNYYASFKKIGKILKGRNFKFKADLVTCRLIHFKNKKIIIKRFNKKKFRKVTLRSSRV